jgi:putative transposase
MACLGFRTFEQILYRWILEAYHRRPHRSLRCSPLQRWTHCEEISAHILPAVPAELDLLMANVKSKPVFHYGIDLDSIRYNSTALQDVARRLKPFVDGKAKAPKMDVRFHDHTVDYVDVLDPTTSTYVRVASVDPEYTTDLDRVSHRALQRRTICDKGTSWTPADRREVRRKTEKDIEENEAHTRNLRRLAKKRAEKGTSRPDPRDTPEDARPGADTATVDSVPEYMRENYIDDELPILDEEAGATRDASVQHGR